MAAKKKTATKAKAPKKAVSRKVAHKAPKLAMKKASAKPTAAKKASAAVSVGDKPFSKSQLIAEITERTGVVKKEVLAVLETINHIIGAHLHKSGPEVFAWPGLFKIQVTKKPATKARQGISPFTGETITFKAKPASRRVKIRALKQLKAMAS